MEMKKHKHVMREMEKPFFYNKKGLSSVVMMVIMIALVMSIMAVVFNLTKKTVEDKIDKSDSCGINILDQLSINDEYVCYNSSTNETVISINRKTLDLDKLLIALETDSDIIKYEISETNITLDNVTNYPDKTEGVQLPNKNGGKTYIISNVNKKPLKIEIAPVVGGNQCDFVDSIDNIIDCSLTTIFN